MIQTTNLVAETLRDLTIRRLMRYWNEPQASTFLPHRRHQRAATAQQNWYHRSRKQTDTDCNGLGVASCLKWGFICQISEKSGAWMGNRAYHPGGHYWNHSPGILSSMSNHCSSFAEQVPVYCIPHYWFFMRAICWSLVDSPHKGPIMWNLQVPNLQVSWRDLTWMSGHQHDSPSKMADRRYRWLCVRLQYLHC